MVQFVIIPLCRTSESSLSFSNFWITIRSISPPFRSFPNTIQVRTNYIHSKIIHVISVTSKLLLSHFKWFLNWPTISIKSKYTVKSHNTPNIENNYYVSQYFDLTYRLKKYLILILNKTGFPASATSLEGAHCLPPSYWDPRKSSFHWGWHKAPQLIKGS